MTRGATFAYNLRFPGQYYDAETGKHYNYFRDYDPAIGRYVQADPLGVMLARSPELQSQLNHMYGYVNGNPIKFVDYRGLCACSGGTWNQDFGDFGFQVAAGGYFGGSNVNLSCKSNPGLKCSAKQVCIGGGPMAGGGAGFSIGGRVDGAQRCGELRGWSDFMFAGSAGPLSMQVNGSGGSSAGGANIGWAFGGAAIRCFTYNLKCNVPCEAQQ
jgi:RHS repeat-associated protein